MNLQATGVSYAFGSVVALDRVTLSIPHGRCVALVGESGAGKTTLLRLFNRMVVPTRGEVRVDDTDVSRQPVEDLRRRIGYVPQQGGLMPHWSVQRNVALVPGLLRQADAAAAAVRALERVGLPPRTFGHRYPHELSGGQRQRVALARAIAARQGALLMDEPFGALDAISRSELQTMCATLRRELGVTTLLVTHDLLEADFLADEMAVMRAGRIEQQGSLDALIARPETPYVESLVARALAGGRRRRMDA
ncbi:MAG TPA: ATP-binding cassette domain-containing protein [Vicinamibacterales bacterium]